MQHLDLSTTKEKGCTAKCFQTNALICCSQWNWGFYQSWVHKFSLVLNYTPQSHIFQHVLVFLDKSKNIWTHTRTQTQTHTHALLRWQKRLMPVPPPPVATRPNWHSSMASHLPARRDWSAHTLSFQTDSRLRPAAPDAIWELDVVDVEHRSAPVSSMGSTQDGVTASDIRDWNPRLHHVVQVPPVSLDYTLHSPGLFLGKRRRTECQGR